MNDYMIPQEPESLPIFRKRIAELEAEITLLKSENMRLREIGRAFQVPMVAGLDDLVSRSIDTTLPPGVIH